MFLKKMIFASSALAYAVSAEDTKLPRSELERQLNAMLIKGRPLPSSSSHSSSSLSEKSESEGDRRVDPSDAPTHNIAKKSKKSKSVEIRREKWSDAPTRGNQKNRPKTSFRENLNKIKGIKENKQKLKAKLKALKTADERVCPVIVLLSIGVMVVFLFTCRLGSVNQTWGAALVIAFCFGAVVLWCVDCLCFNGELSTIHGQLQAQINKKEKSLQQLKRKMRSRSV